MSYDVPPGSSPPEPPPPSTPDPYAPPPPTYPPPGAGYPPPGQAPGQTPPGYGPQPPPPPGYGPVPPPGYGAPPGYGQPPPAYGYPPPPGAYGYPVAQTSGKAIAVLVLGILSLVGSCFGGFILAIIAVSLAPSGRREIQASMGRLGGEGQIKAGVICAWISIGLAVLGLVVIIGGGVMGSHDSFHSS